MTRLPGRLAIIGCGFALSLMVGVVNADIVVVVSAQNPIDTLTRAELTDIYLGRLKRLPNGDLVVPIDQKDGSSAHREFYDEYFNWSPAQIRAHWSKLIFTGRGQPPRSVSSGNAAADIIAGDPRAIGYVDSDLIDHRLRVVPIE